MTKRLAWEVGLGVAGAAYLILALVFQLSSPLLGLAIVLCAVHELIKPRRAKPE